MARSRRMRGRDWFVVVVGIVVVFGIGTGAFMPALQAGAAWVSPYVIAWSQAFGAWFAQALTPGR